MSNQSRQAAEQVDDSPRLAMALLAAQREMPSVVTDSTNPHFGSQYLSLHGLQEALRPVLTRNDLLWIAMPGEEDGRPVLQYSLLHGPSRESIGGTMPLLLGSQQTSQALGSAITYARRYALSAVLGIAADDDDGEGASQKATAKAKPGMAATVKPSERPATAAQRRLISVKAAEAGVGMIGLVHLINDVSGERREELGSEEDAQRRAAMKLDRLSMGLVDGLLDAIKQAAVNG